MKVITESFEANNPNLKISDIISSHYVFDENKESSEQLFSFYKDKSGVINLRFCTKDKYVNIDTNGWSCFEGKEGSYISIEPFLEDTEAGECLDYTDGSKYFKHPDWYNLSLIFVMDSKAGYLDIVSPLKHEYIITYVPHNISICTNPKDFKGLVVGD